MTTGEITILKDIAMDEIPITIQAGLYRYVGGREQSNYEIWGMIWCWNTILKEIVRIRKEQLRNEKKKAEDGNNKIKEEK